MKNYKLLTCFVCALLFSKAVFSQNKVPTLAKQKPQTALLIKKDSTHKVAKPQNKASSRVVGPVVTLSKAGQIVAVSPHTLPAKTVQTKSAQPQVTLSKRVQTKSAQSQIVSPKTVQTKPVQPKVASPKVVQTKSAQSQIVSPKTVQSKPAPQAVVASRIVQSKSVPQLPAPPKNIQTYPSSPQIAPTKTVQTHAVAQKTTTSKVSPNNMLLASIVPPKTKPTVAKSVKISSRRYSPPTEFRGVWVSTVQQVDFPTKESVDPSVLRSEWLRLLKFYKTLNLNAVIVQVRPTADAIYPSKIVPYSKWLTGQSGKPLAGNFDMLKFMIETSHTEGIEFHAWINPYRVLVDNDTMNLGANHVFKTHRNWVLKYGKEHHLNPGIPEVWKHITAVMEEIVVNYDIDAVHFDDYFYPYRIDGEALKDGEAFKRYGKKFKNVDDWRRANTDSMFFNVRQVIKKHKPYVQLGVSPFAVWRNKTDSIDLRTNPGLTEGSETHAYQSCYADLYADVVSWMRRGWLDYVAPEVYFHKNHPLVGYENAVDWWLKNSYGTPVYISHAIYKVNNKEKYPEWRDPNEIPRQLDLVRTKQNVKGLVFFSSRWLLENQLGVTDSIRNNFFYQPSQLPKVSNRK